MKIDKIVRRNRRKKSIRNKIYGTEDRPRLTVFRSLNNIYAQIINDDQRITLVSASTLDKELNIRGKKNKEAAQAVGQLIAKRAKDKKIEKVKFDRNGYLYHGKVKALADGAREGGLSF